VKAASRIRCRHSSEASAVLAAIALCSSCADRTGRNSYVEDRVNAIRGLTIPVGASVGNNSAPTLGHYCARARWEFETSEEKHVYLSWVTGQLDHADFKLKSSDESSLVFTRSLQGDSESVRAQVATSNGMSDVEIDYTIDSD